MAPCAGHLSGGSLLNAEVIGKMTHSEANTADIGIVTGGGGAERIKILKKSDRPVLSGSWLVSDKPSVGSAKKNSPGAEATGLLALTMGS